MVRFENIDFLWALIGIPLFIIIFIFFRRWQKKVLASLGDRVVVLKMIPDVSFKKPIIKFVLFLVSYSLIIIGIANPQIGLKSEEVKKSGSDIMLLLDVSNSMLAQDMIPNRLENAKRGISQLIDKMRNDRIGIIVFAGQAYVQLPITTDYSAAKLFLNTINTNIVPVQGTAIGAAIDMGIRSFDFKDGLNKAMILMTDGENHEDDAIGAASKAKDHKVDIHVIGLGSLEGAPIPTIKEGKTSGYFTDSVGQTVISKMDEKMCREIADAGNGIYVRATNTGSGLSIIFDKLEGMQKKNYQTQIFKDYEDRFQVFLIPAFIFLVFEFFVTLRKSKAFNKLNLFEVKT